jgi:hypothetical protein
MRVGCFPVGPVTGNICQASSLTPHFANGRVEDRSRYAAPKGGWKAFRCRRPKSRPGRAAGRGPRCAGNGVLRRRWKRSTSRAFGEPRLCMSLLYRGSRFCGTHWALRAPHAHHRRRLQTARGAPHAVRAAPLERVSPRVLVTPGLPCASVSIATKARSKTSVAKFACAVL